MPSVKPTTTQLLLNCSCGVVKRATRIVGGSATEVHGYPWQVGLVNFPTGRIWCGGSLISIDTVLTAAHCLEGEHEDHLMVKIGEHDQSTTSDTNMTMVVPVSKFIIHPDYDHTTYANDIALLKLKTPIIFNVDNNIAPVCLPPEGNTTYNGYEATVTGWGDTTYGGSTSSVLQEVNLPIISNNDCATVYGDIKPTMICAGVPAGGFDSCQDDSGGPLVTYLDTNMTFMAQIGIVSFGEKCALPKTPGVYTRVSEYISWIMSECPGMNTCDPPGPKGPMPNPSTSAPLPMPVIVTTTTRAPRPPPPPTYPSATNLNCGPKIINPGYSYFFKSKNYPRKYPHRQFCTWKFASKKGSFVKVTCTVKSIQGSSKCAADYLKIKGKKYCGKNKPKGTFTGTYLTIIFRSDKTKNAYGFRCTVKATVLPTTTTTPPPYRCTCGLPNYPARIVGGSETAPHQYPWQVGLTSFRSGPIRCGGSIISEQWILTAARCVYGRSTIGLYVRISEHEQNIRKAMSIPSYVEQVVEIHVHPDYDPMATGNDIALLKLAYAIKFQNDNSIAPICLPPSNSVDKYEGNMAIVAGWGKTLYHGVISATLQSAMVTVVPNSNCSDSALQNMTGILCAGHPSGGKDACHGDEGGPLATYNTASLVQIGIDSFGEGCGLPNKTRAYTRVTEYTSWISTFTSGPRNCPPSNAAAPVITPPPVPSISPSCKCGQVKMGSRIVGGNVTEINEYPWQVGLGLIGYHGYICGGAIISQQWVVTAAHCTIYFYPYQMSVTVGDHDQYSPADGIVYKVIQIVENTYNETSMLNDIALLKLASAIPFPADNTIAPICLPANGTVYSDGTDVIVTGWGRTGSNEPSSPVLKEVAIPIVNNTFCNTVYGDIVDSMICAGTPQGGLDSCQGDSGGPMIAQSTLGQYMELAGVVSFGEGCALPDKPGVYARVTSYLTWIAGYTNGDLTCPSS